ncbi:MAG: DUF1254 domain-containing protein [Planctomycetaceae bacterium]|jgi:hypothetical protein|nr:DUF1254 domain-containing protein [Planctomycetaceae bacterium]
MRVKATIVAIAFCCLSVTSVAAQVPVTPDNYLRAETDSIFKKKVDEGYFGKIGHVRKAISIDNQLVIRMNRDTLFSFGVFDLTQPVTIVKPDTGKRFQSMLVINEDHYIKLTAYDPGEYRPRKEILDGSWKFPDATPLE